MQKSSATPKNQDVGRGLRKIVACSQSSSQCLFSFWHGLIPTSYFIFNDFDTCSTHFFSHKYSQDTVGSLASAVHECRSCDRSRGKARAQSARGARISEAAHAQYVQNGD